MRFVNTTTSNDTPSTRRWSSECDDTSIATGARRDRSTRGSMRWSSIGPGVVSPPPPSSGVPSLPIKTPSVPIEALRTFALVEQVAQHVDRRRLAVRAGDADELERRARESRTRRRRRRPPLGDRR